MKIQKTENLNKFVTITGNREISRRKVQKIIASYQDGLHLFHLCPIIVAKADKDSFMIIDGQHRYQACLEMALPVYYVVAEEISLRDIARMNSATDKWKEADFLHCYSELGNGHYKLLAQFMHIYGVRYSIAVQLTMYGKMFSGRIAMEKFRDGSYTCDHYDKAEKIIQLMDFLFGRYIFSRDKFLIEAVIKLEEIGLWDVERMSKILEKNPNIIQQQSSKKNWIQHLELIYNKGSHKRLAIWQ